MRLLGMLAERVPREMAQMRWLQGFLLRDLHEESPLPLGLGTEVTNGSSGMGALSPSGRFRKPSLPNVGRGAPRGVRGVPRDDGAEVRQMRRLFLVLHGMRLEARQVLRVWPLQLPEGPARVGRGRERVFLVRTILLSQHLSQGGSQDTRVEGLTVRENAKSETQNPKQTLNPKSQHERPAHRGGCRFLLTRFVRTFTNHPPRGFR